jgi:hypothetical protein
VTLADIAIEVSEENATQDDNRPLIEMHEPMEPDMHDSMKPDADIPDSDILIDLPEVSVNQEQLVPDLEENVDDDRDSESGDPDEDEGEDQERLEELERLLKEENVANEKVEGMTKLPLHRST